jgi:uncharacterized protein YecE (DUF72 family)
LLGKFRVRARIRVGISGWRYSGWRGKFYPAELPQKRELEYASRQVNSIEINGSFYSLQRPENYHTWHEATPADFVFSVKASRFLTHMRRLKNADTALANFLASGILRLREKLGPILWQLPPNFAYDRARLEAFFRSLPRTTTEAAALAREHDSKVAGRAYTESECECPLRHALEVRHPSFEDRDFITLLREHNVALVVADTAGKWPFLEDVTSDFVYVRLHGDTELYVSGYTPAALQNWARKVRAWAAGRTPASAKLVAPRPNPRSIGRDVFVYFDNDAKVHAPFDAISLMRRLGVATPSSREIESEKMSS